VKDYGQSYEFTLMYGDVKLKKSESDIMNLRNHLLKIYKNLATVPEVYDFEKKIIEQDLDKVKEKID
jgi:hypothetical protein